MLASKLRRETTVMGATFRSLLTAMALIAMVGVADAGKKKGARRADPCPEAGRAVVWVPDGIDGIRVIVDQAVPDAATDVTVLAGERDRTVRALGAGVFGLSLDEPLRAPSIQVAVEPVLEARTAACVSRIELLRGGTVVGTAQIK